MIWLFALIAWLWFWGAMVVYQVLAIDIRLMDGSRREWLSGWCIVIFWPAVMPLIWLLAKCEEICAWWGEA